MSVIRLGLVGSAIIATLLLFAGTFPQPEGHDVGGPPVLLWLSIPLSAAGGLLLGMELSKLSPRFRHRPIIASLQLVGVFLVVTPALIYGRVVAPQFFELSVIRSYYGVPIILGAVLVVVQHGHSLVRYLGRVTSERET